MTASILFLVTKAVTKVITHTVHKHAHTHPFLLTELQKYEDNTKNTTKVLLHNNN